MRYKGIHITCEAAEQEVWIAYLSDFSFESFQEGERLSAFMNSENWEKEKNSVINFLKSESLSFSEEDFEDVNWNAEWEKNFEPLDIEGKIHVRADFHPKNTSAEAEIIISPQMSFGTGHHATTYLMLEEMHDMDFKGKEVLDMGSGTGILGIYASMKGAKSILATDIEEWAIENAKENISRNAVSNMKVIQADIDKVDGASRFEVIIANINRNVLIAHLPSYFKLMSSEAHVLLSGILSEDKNMMHELCSKLGLELVKEKERGNWTTLHYRKP